MHLILAALMLAVAAICPAVAEDSLDSAIAKLKSSNSVQRAIGAIEVQNIARRGGDAGGAVPALIDVLADDTPLGINQNVTRSTSPRVEASKALVLVGAAAVDPLIDALRTKNRSREGAAQTLGKIKDVKAVMPLIQALPDDDGTGSEAARALWETDLDDRAASLLVTFLGSRNETAKENAAVAMGSVHDARFVEPLLAILRSIDERPREAAATALQYYNEPRVISALANALRPRDKVNGRDEMTIIHAARALAHIDNDEAIKRLVEALAIQYPPRVYSLARTEIVLALAKTNNPMMIDAFIAIVRSGDNTNGGRVMTEAAASLGKFPGEKITDTLIFVLSRGDWDTKMAVVELLGERGDMRAVVPLIQVLKKAPGGGDSLAIVTQRALVQLTGTNSAKTSEEWLSWWNAQQC